MRVWRLCRKRHVAAAFSGEGARLFAARWNSAGTPMVYTSMTLALAVVEVFVHLRKDQAPDDFMAVCAELPVNERALEAERTSLLERLPRGWKREAHPVPRAIGDEWAQSGRSLALMVPSVAVEGEWNVLVNPRHASVGKIKIIETKPFHFDERMFR